MSVQDQRSDRPALAEKTTIVDSTSSVVARHIEEAALRAWPAAQQLLYDGWVVRLSDGYTKRANSASLLYPLANSDHVLAVDRIEHLYRSQGRPVIFRLLSFTTPREVVELLAARGFREADGTLVMSCVLQSVQAAPTTVQKLDPEQGIAAHARMNGISEAVLTSHRRILERIPTDWWFAGLFVADELVACGLSVLDGDLVGLFDVVTDAAHRRKGFGAQLVRGMMSEARELGASNAYLQVVETNAPAITLYRAIGFSETYRYAYRLLD